MQLFSHGLGVVHLRRPYGADLEMCHVFSDSIFLKQKIYCSFLKMERVGTT